MDKAKIKDTMLDGLLRNNPTFVLVLGTCPTIATTTSLFNAFAMGVATMFVLIFSNLFISLLRKAIPDRVRIPCYIVIISTFVIIVRQVMNRFMPDLYTSIGTFIDLIVVNCIILARAESYASCNKPLYSMLDARLDGAGVHLRAVHHRHRARVPRGRRVCGVCHPRVPRDGRDCGEYLRVHRVRVHDGAVQFPRAEVERARKARGEGAASCQGGGGGGEMIVSVGAAGATVSIVAVMFSAVISNNIVLSQYQGICPFLGVSKKMSSAVGMGFAVIFVLAVSSVFCWLVYNFILLPLELDYLYTMAFILVIASLVQVLEIVLKRFSPTLYSALGIYLPLITTNCAILGAANSAVVYQSYSFLYTFCFSVATGIGFLLAIVLLAGVRFKTDKADIPKCFKGFPITLITAALMAMAFAGFAGILAG